MSFVLGGTSTSNRERRPDYISRNTSGVGIRVRVNGGSFTGTRTVPGPGNVAADVSAGSVNCNAPASDGSRTCTVLVVATVGYNDFEITAWDAPPAGGSFAAANELENTLLLNSLVESNQSNSLGFTLNGVVASVALSVSPTSLPSGTSGSATLTVLAKDARGNIIISPGTYTDANGSPVTITVSATPACAMSPPACNSPGTTVLGQSTFTGPSVRTTTLIYDGGALTSSTLAVTAPSLTGNTGATLSFTNTTGGIPIPGAPVIAEFTPTTSSNSNGFITVGPDGNLWFSEGSANKIAFVTTAGAFTEYTIPTAGAQPRGIATGSDGAIWFAEQDGNKIGRVTTAGIFTEYPIPSVSPRAMDLRLGPDGNIWFAEFNTDKIGKITPAGVITEYSTPTSGSGPIFVAAGPDGNVWFTEFNGHKVGKIDPSGSITEYSSGLTGGSINGIALGSDGNLWFCDAGKIGRITPSGTVTEFAGISGTGITSGADGNLWITESGAAKVARMTTSGSYQEFSSGITPGSSPWGITLGPDNNVWLTETAAPGKIGKIVP